MGYESLEKRELLAVVPLQPFSVSENTGEKPQSKVWEHAGQWWSVMPNSQGTWVWRLDGTTWTPTLRVSTNNGINADVLAVDDLVHVLLYSGQNSQLATIEYQAGINPGYQMWSERPGLVNVTLGSGVETATIAQDSTSRLWVAYDTSGRVDVRYSDGLYTTWSAPITVSTGIKSDDIAVITALPDNTIGVLWSNQNTERFGFSIHVDGTAPTLWSSDELPASQSALNTGGGMADDHLNVAVASDGTLYAAVKTSYDSSSTPTIALLVRRPWGAWDNLYQVHTGGTRPIVILNEEAGRLIVAYTSSNGGGSILYRESPTHDISFGAQQTLLSGSQNNVTSTKQNFTDHVVVMASTGSQARSVLFSFDTISLNQAPVVNAGPNQTVPFDTAATLVGTVIDDGLPAGDTLTTVWSQISGPGVVTFDDAASAVTTAMFSAAGSYVLRLTASDGQFTRTDDVTVVVQAAPEPDPVPPPVGTPPMSMSFQDGLFPTIAYAGTRDTQIHSGLPGTSFGTTSVLSIDGTPDVAALLKWDISEVPTTSLVVSAAIELNITLDSPANYEVYALERAWDELSATWDRYAANTDWSTAGADGVGDHSTAVLGQLNPGGNGIYRIALNGAGLAAVQAWISDPDANHGIIVKDYNESATTTTTTTTTTSGRGLKGKGSATTVTTTTTVPVTMNFSSREAAIASLRPKLLLDYVLTEPVNEPPSVDAGANQTIADGESANLNGLVNDDGLPDDPVALTTMWSKFSGPGTVTFGDSSAENTTASFSAPGTYVLRLAADDGEFEAFDDVTIVVDPPNTAPQVDAGTNQSIFVNQTADLNGTVTDDGVPSNGALTTTWSKVSGPGTVTFGNSGAVDTMAEFSLPGTYVLELRANDGQLQTADEVTIIVDAVPNQAPQADAGPNRTVELGTAAVLDGTVTDDGQPTPATLTTTWTKSSGPGTVTFANDSAVDTTAQFSEVGEYVLRLTANDGELETFDEMTVVVDPVNLAPVVGAGDNQLIELPASANLSGSVSDDGLPNGGTLTHQWSRFSGPGTVTFGNSGALETTASFSLPGTYVLRLTANDGARTSFASVTIVVEAANTPPVVNAGSNQSILIGQTASLSGSVTDDGKPTTGVLTMAWSQFSGPGTVTFGSVSSPSTTAEFSEAGTYVLRLLADDGEFIAFDDVTVNVAQPVSAPTNDPPPRKGLKGR